MRDDPFAGLRADPDLPPGRSLSEAALAHDPKALFAVLQRHHVRYVLIGGMASIVHGYQRPTDDVDITPQRAMENIGRLIDALIDLDAQRRVNGLAEGLPTTWDERILRQPSVPLVTRHGFLDLAFDPDGTKGYDDLIQDAENRTVLGHEVVVASIHAIVRSKTAANRQKDIDALNALRRIAASQED